jgi:hypothetical protein
MWCLCTSLLATNNALLLDYRRVYTKSDTTEVIYALDRLDHCSPGEYLRALASGPLSFTATRFLLEPSFTHITANLSGSPYIAATSIMRDAQTRIMTCPARLSWSAIRKHMGMAFDSCQNIGAKYLHAPMQNVSARPLHHRGGAGHSATIVIVQRWRHVQDKSKVRLPQRGACWHSRMPPTDPQSATATYAENKNAVCARNVMRTFICDR